MIAQVSEFTVGASGSFSSADFTFYKTVAGKMLDDLDPGLDDDRYDLAHAYMICHIFATKGTDTSLSGEKIGNSSLQRSAIGKTRYLLMVEQLVADVTAKKAKDAKPTQGVQRLDADIKEFRLDGNTPPSTFDADDVEAL